MKRQRRRRFSQHFLNSTKIAQRMAAHARVSGETVIEIGPGKGMLTTAIAGQAARVFAIEIDPKMTRELQALRLPNVHIINDDLLRHDVRQYGPVVVIGNIPYAISSAIIEMIARNHDVIAHATLTVQREFARRLTARPGTPPYGFITLYANYHYAIRKAFTIAARFFTPRPRVNSMVIRLEKRTPMFVLADEGDFFEFIRGVFRYPRKVVRNSLSLVVRRAPIGIDERLLARRPAALDLEDFYALYMGIKRHGG